MNNKPIIVGISLIVIVLVGSAFWYHSSTEHVAQQFYTVESGVVSSTVTSTGTVVAAQNVDLAFQQSGRVVSAPVAVGDTVYAGEVLASLDSSSLNAQLAEAQAQVAAQTANLDQLQQGANPQQIQLQQTAIAAAQATLLQTEKSAVAQINTAYTAADSAVHDTADEFFTGGQTANPTLNIPVNDNASKIALESTRASMEATLTSWNTSIGSLSTSSDLETYIAQAEQNVSSVSSFLDMLATAVNSLTPNANLSQATIDGYKASVAASRQALSSSSVALVGAETAYKGAESGVTLAQNQLAVEQAGGVADQVKAQEAQVAQAQASVQSLQAVIAETVIRSPIAGTITAQNAKVGQTATPGAPVISIISNGTFQIDSYFPEPTTGEVNVGDSAIVTLDAYAGVVFSAKVVTIDPAETIVNGVPSYKVTLQFSQADNRIQSGMTANITVATNALTAAATSTSAATTAATSTLAIPEQSIISNNNIDYVLVKQPDGSLVTQEIQIGAQDSNGMVEVTSGLNAGDQIVKFN